MKRWTTTFVLLVLVAMGAWQPYRAQAATFVDVTVRIRCVNQVENPDDASGDGDYFPEVKIGASDASHDPTSPGQLGAGPIEDDTFCPDWRFTRSVDRDAGPVAITIRLFDYDDGFNGDNDFMDINPIDNKVELGLSFDASTGALVDGSDVRGNFARGDGDHGVPDDNDGRKAEVEFYVFVGTNPDVDGDGIPDAVEINGVRAADGTMVTDFAALGADPCRRTIAVWIDYMTGAADGHSHKPKGDGIQALVTAFDQAPLNAVACPYAGTHKSTGVDFIYIEGKPIPEQAVMGLDGGFRAARDANFPPELRPFAHYAIFVHDQKAGSSSSGLCCETVDGNRDFLVSLGSWRNTCVAPGDDPLSTTPQGDDMVLSGEIDVGANLDCDTPAAAGDVQILAVGTGAADARVGTAVDQAGTIMHELGHALGLGHGGDEETNYMPNYLSNMNYAFQLGVPRGATPPGAAAPPRVLDYSRSKLPDLVKSTLKESVGLGVTGLTDWTRWTDGGGNARWGSAAGAIDWDWSSSTDNGGVACGDGTSVCLNVNINADDDSGAPQGVLTGFDDWQNLKYRATDSASFGAENARPHPDIPDVTFPTVLKEQLEYLASFDPDLQATKMVDKADAVGGEALVYTVDVANVGTGPATNASVVDTFPTGHGKTAETRPLATIYPGATKSETFMLTVDCATPDGTLLLNSATASGTDMGGGAEANLANNTDTASTTVHAPKLQVSTSATGTGLAGEAITFRTVVTNTGSGAAANLVVKDVLPRDVYYSTSLDLGAGPRPSSVSYAANAPTTLVWNVATLAAGDVLTLEYTARPSLLFLGGEALANAVEVSYKNANGCTFAPERASASSTITVVAPTRDPLTPGFWRTHPEMWDLETLARIQATDQRFDLDGNGALSNAEAAAVLDQGGNMDAVLKRQLAATYFNLGTRRINAATALDPRAKLVARLGLTNVRAAVIYARETLLLPVTSPNRARYSDATTVLDEINGNKIELY